MSRTGILLVKALLLGSTFVGSYALVRAKSTGEQIRGKDGTLSNGPRGCSTHGAVARPTCGSSATHRRHRRFDERVDSGSKSRGDSS